MRIFFCLNIFAVLISKLFGAYPYRNAAFGNLFLLVFLKFENLNVGPLSKLISLILFLFLSASIVAPVFFA